MPTAWRPNWQTTLVLSHTFFTSGGTAGSKRLWDRLLVARDKNTRHTEVTP